MKLHSTYDNEVTFNVLKYLQDRLLTDIHHFFYGLFGVTTLLAQMLHISDPGFFLLIIFTLFLCLFACFIFVCLFVSVANSLVRSLYFNFMEKKTIIKKLSHNTTLST